ncbi:hypothetical protein QJS04_geneDACA001275 [Acorus gramineus]|uniref:Uncharacterized protein n=1 Tax=Acorus gramineus TaxID=55184 RepID=A0AAV9AE80_ACOGR|nr:hypothetical protein QJS04_geneDACA001275 [Acorus gramineus]
MVRSKGRELGLGLGLREWWSLIAEWRLSTRRVSVGVIWEVLMVMASSSSSMGVGSGGDEEEE